MEQFELMIPVSQPVFTMEEEQVEKENQFFITANTVASTYQEIRNNHIIPVYAKDNEPLISQSEFIEVMAEVVSDSFQGEVILNPLVRLSHPIKGRVPEARNKPANQLDDWEKTLYYERMAFIIEIPSIQDTIDGNSLSLTIGGVKSYNLDNLYSRKGTEEHFKVFIGFKNRVCTNLCVWTDGFMGDLKVKNLQMLRSCIQALIHSYDKQNHLHSMRRLAEYALTEHQFALLVGRCRMYNHLPLHMKAEIPSLLFNDTQVGAVCRDYYRDNSFCRDKNGNINLWRLYNLFTGANKTSYIDLFLDRSINAYSFVEQVRSGLESRTTNWYLM